MTKPKRRRDGSGKFLPKNIAPRAQQRPDIPRPDALPTVTDGQMPVLRSTTPGSDPDLEKIANLPLRPGERIIDEKGNVVAVGDGLIHPIKGGKIPDNAEGRPHDERNCEHAKFLAGGWVHCGKCHDINEGYKLLHNWQRRKLAEGGYVNRPTMQVMGDQPVAIPIPRQLADEIKRRGEENIIVNVPDNFEDLNRKDFLKMLRRQRPAVPSPDPTPPDPKPAGCAECGADLTETRIATRNGRILIIHCPECVPDPVAAIRGDE